MRSAYVYRNKDLAGILVQENPTSYTFTYDDAYYEHPEKLAISMTLPKTQ